MAIIVLIKCLKTINFNFKVYVTVTVIVYCNVLHNKDTGNTKQVINKFN